MASVRRDREFFTGLLARDEFIGDHVRIIRGDTRGREFLQRSRQQIGRDQPALVGENDQLDPVQISPVPQGEVKEARAGMGHYHLGVDTDCLPAGTDIPKAEAGATPGNAGSWIHFGTGSNNIEMALTPGPHKFSVEVGDA